jgi:hypothetical protein
MGNKEGNKFLLELKKTVAEGQTSNILSNELGTTNPQSPLPPSLRTHKKL